MAHILALYITLFGGIFCTLSAAKFCFRDDFAAFGAMCVFASIAFVGFFSLLFKGIL